MKKFVTLLACLLALPLLAGEPNNLSSLANATESQIVQAAKTDAHEYFQRLIQAGVPFDNSTNYNAVEYGEGCAVEHNLSGNPATKYQLAFDAVFSFLLQEQRMKHLASETQENTR
jgi:hypothetical protein